MRKLFGYSGACTPKSIKPSRAPPADFLQIVHIVQSASSRGSIIQVGTEQHCMLCFRTDDAGVVTDWKKCASSGAFVELGHLPVDLLPQSIVERHLRLPT